MFKLSFKTSNAAFCEDDPCDLDLDDSNASELTAPCAAEIARILRMLADSIDNGQEYGAVYDVNGNRVGMFEYSGD